MVSSLPPMWWHWKWHVGIITGTSHPGNCDRDFLREKAARDWSYTRQYENKQKTFSSDSADLNQSNQHWKDHKGKKEWDKNKHLKLLIFLKWCEFWESSFLGALSRSALPQFRFVYLAPSAQKTTGSIKTCQPLHKMVLRISLLCTVKIFPTNHQN